MLKKFYFFLLLIVFFVPTASILAQSLSFSDPAFAYQKLILEQNNNTYTKVGIYNVSGSPYIYGDNLKGDIYYNKEVIVGGSFRINNYAHEIEIEVPDAKGKYLFINMNSLDSFHIYKNLSKQIYNQLDYINSSLIDKASAPVFLQILSRGKYNLYKSYKTSVTIPTNYADPNLREFSLSADYYYIKSEDPNDLRKIRQTSAGIKKAFGKDYTKSPDTLEGWPNFETVLLNLMTELNN